MRLAEVSKLKVAVSLLATCLAASLFFNIYPLLVNDCKISESEDLSATFVFFDMNRISPSSPEYRKFILNSTEFVRMEVTFSWETDNLTVSAKVNDDEYHPRDYLGLAFDPDEDGLFESVYWLSAANYTINIHDFAYITTYGGIESLACTVPYPSTWHYCTFNSSGYFFHFSIPKATINFHPSILTHLCFCDTDAITPGKSFEAATVYWEFEVQT
jgi:hypothetical protein